MMVFLVQWFRTNSSMISNKDASLFTVLSACAFGLCLLGLSLLSLTSVVSFKPAERGKSEYSKVFLVVIRSGVE